MDTPPTLALTGVGGSFTASHTDAFMDEGTHEHTWQVIAWYPAEPFRDARSMRGALVTVLETFEGHGERGAPVWHTGEPLDRLYRLCEEWPRVCVGSTDDHWQVLGDPWRARMDEAFNGLAQRHRRMPWLHMLRGMQLATESYPFASLDSTDVARNHNRPRNTARAMADRWDAAQCPPTWVERLPPPDLFEEAAA